MISKIHPHNRKTPPLKNYKPFQLVNICAMFTEISELYTFYVLKNLPGNIQSNIYLCIYQSERDYLTKIVTKFSLR